MMKFYYLVNLFLQEIRRASNSDKELIWVVMDRLNLTHQVYDDTRSNTIYDRTTVGFISKSKFMECPAFESITRARRKVQENHPELQADEEIRTERQKKEEMGGNFVYHERVDDVQRDLFGNPIK